MLLGDGSEDVPVDPIPEYSAREEFEDEKNWRSVTVGDRQFRIDMKVIEPYKKVLSHGGRCTPCKGFNPVRAAWCFNALLEGPLPWR